MNTTVERKPLALPGGHDKVLLHSCCAPCAGEVMEAMLASGIDCTIFFYNPNIHPLKEYELRKNEISKRESFYQQEYCGCVYSLRDTDRHHVEYGRERIRLGVRSMVTNSHPKADAPRWVSDVTPWFPTDSISAGGSELSQ